MTPDTPAAQTAKHNRVLLHAHQTAHPVLYAGQQRFIHTLTFMSYGGGIKTLVYLAGDPAPVEAEAVQLQEHA